MRKFPDIVNRRGLLGAGVSFGFLGATSLFAQVSNPKIPSSNLKVIITLGNTTYSYPDGPTHPDYRVSFRSDGSVNALYGSIWSRPQADLGPYTATINGTNNAVPRHGWFQSWTYRPTPLAVKKTPAQIVAANRSFPFGNTGCTMSPLGPHTFAGPMDNAGIGKSMIAGGAGPERGLVSDVTGYFMRTGNAAPMFGWALAADSVPINYVDAHTGKPVDILAYPTANIYSPNLKPFWPRGLSDPTGQYQLYTDGWDVDIHHFPSMTYTAFQASLDVSLLYNLQHAANFPSISDPYKSTITGKALVNEVTTRELAWGWRNIFEAHVATMDAEALGILPADLHPPSYFKKLLDNNLAFYLPRMRDPKEQTFRLIGPNLTHIAPWQTDYMLTVMAFAVLTGHSDWTQFYLWTLGNIIFRTNGKSGWPPALCCAYKMNTCDENDPAQKRFTWAQAFDNQMKQTEVLMPKAEHDALLADPLNGGNASPRSRDAALFGCYAAITMADYLDKKGMAAIRATYPDFDVCLSRIVGMTKKYGKMNERFSVVDH